MSEHLVEVRVRLAWWFKPWLNTLIALCWLCGTEPCELTVRRMTRYAARVEIVKC